MRSLLFLIPAIYSLSVCGQTAYQPGEVLGETPVLGFTYPDSSAPNGLTQYTSMLTVDNYDMGGARFAFGSYYDELELDTFISHGLISWPEMAPTSYYLTSGTVVSSMFFAAGLGHRTVVPIRPVVTCTSLNPFVIINPDSSSTSQIPVSWEYEVSDLEYLEFNPKFIGFTIENEEVLSSIPDPFGSFVMPIFLGLFNVMDTNELRLQVRRLVPEIGGLDEVLVEIPLQYPFYINSTKEFDGQLLISGFELNEETGLRKFAQQYQIDLESGEWERNDRGFEFEHTEVVSSTIMESGSVASLVEETDILGTWLQTKLMLDGIELARYTGDFHPTKIVGDYWGKIRLGGDYNFYGVNKAAVVDVSPITGSVTMKGYADIPDGNSSFRYFHKSEYGKYIAGYFVGATESNSFLTKMQEGNLLSVSQERQDHLATFRGSSLVFNKGGTHQYSVIDASGRLIRSDKTISRTVDLNLSTGFYTVTVTNEETTQSLKVILTN